MTPQPPETVSDAFAPQNDTIYCLIGASGSGKSTFARRHFTPAETTTFDYFRRSATGRGGASAGEAAAARSLLGHSITQCLTASGHTVVDATNSDRSTRLHVVGTAGRHHRAAVALVMTTSLAECLRRNARRPGPGANDLLGTRMDPEVIRAQHQRISVLTADDLRAEGFTEVKYLASTGQPDRPDLVPDGPCPGQDNHLLAFGAWSAANLHADADGGTYQIQTAMAACQRPTCGALILQIGNPGSGPGTQLRIVEPAFHVGGAA